MKLKHLLVDVGQTHFSPWFRDELWRKQKVNLSFERFYLSSNLAATPNRSDGASFGSIFALQLSRNCAFRAGKAEC